MDGFGITGYQNMLQTRLTHHEYILLSSYICIIKIYLGLMMNDAKNVYRSERFII